MVHARLDPNQDYVGHNFLLSPDTVAGGTDITVGRVPLIGRQSRPARPRPTSWSLPAAP